jgi:hypothetical protein
MITTEGLAVVTLCEQAGVNMVSKHNLKQDKDGSKRKVTIERSIIINRFIDDSDSDDDNKNKIK